MSKLGTNSQRKRPPAEPSKATQPEPKRQKLDNHCVDSRFPLHYLDTLSKVWLTKEALKKLDRRTHRTDPVSKRVNKQGRRPLTRGLHQELRSKACSTITPASEFLTRCSLESLKSIKLFARYGGPDLLDLRGIPEPTHPSRYTMSSTQSSRRKRGKRSSESTSRTPTTSTAVTKITSSSGAYNPNFEQRMIDNSIYPHGYEYTDGRIPPKPQNWKEIQQILAERRPSLSPSTYPEETFDEFARADAQVSSENRATTKVIPMIQGTIRDEECVEGDILFNNLADMMNGKSHKAKPDVYYGSRPEQLDPAIRSQLNAYIVPSTTQTRPIVPNFFVEAKQPGGSARVASNQACFVGATGARGIHSLQKYGEDAPTYDNNAYTLSATYHSGQLKMYAHHSGQPKGLGSSPEYYMSQLGAYAMTHNRDALIQGITAFRNAVDWTEAQRTNAIATAVAAWNAQHNGDSEGENDEDDHEGDEQDELAVDPILSSFTSLSSITATQSVSYGKAVRRGSDTSPEELALDFRHSSRKKTSQRRDKG